MCSWIFAGLRAPHRHFRLIAGALSPRGQIKSVEACEMKADKPVVFVSPSCKYCKSLIERIDRSGAGDSYRFVNVNREKALPKFVDRVPLMFDGRNIRTDSDLFDLFREAGPGPSSTMAAPQVAPSSGLEGVFSNSFSALDDAVAGDTMQAGNLWLVDESHDSIETPECKPMPEKED